MEIPLLQILAASGKARAPSFVIGIMPFKKWVFRHAFTFFALGKEQTGNRKTKRQLHVSRFTLQVVRISARVRDASMDIGFPQCGEQA